MKKSLIIMILSLFGFAQASPPTPVTYVDLTRYAGKWYEIARYPQWFEKGMTGVTAEYIPEEGYIRVINRGWKNGKMKTVKGKAFVAADSGNAKLKVQFFWPFRGDYWIIGLASDYSWAVVSNKHKSTLWILSRTPQMNPETLTRILNTLQNNGFDMERIEITEQK